MVAMRVLGVVQSCRFKALEECPGFNPVNVDTSKKGDHGPKQTLRPELTNALCFSNTSC